MGCLREYSRLGLVCGTFLQILLDCSCNCVIIENAARDEVGACVHQLTLPCHLAAAYLFRDQLIKTSKFNILHSVCCSELTA